MTTATTRELGPRLSTHIYAGERLLDAVPARVAGGRYKAPDGSLSVTGAERRTGPAPALQPFPLPEKPKSTEKPPAKPEKSGVLGCLGTLVSIPFLIVLGIIGEALEAIGALLELVFFWEPVVLRGNLGSAARSLPQPLRTPPEPWRPIVAVTDRRMLVFARNNDSGEIVFLWQLPRDQVRHARKRWRLLFVRHAQVEFADGSMVRLVPELSLGRAGSLVRALRARG